MWHTVIAQKSATEQRVAADGINQFVRAKAIAAEVHRETGDYVGVYRGKMLGRLVAEFGSAPWLASKAGAT